MTECSGSVKIMKRDIKSMLPCEIEDYFLSIGDKPYRAKQVFSWLHQGVTSFSEMTNISGALREKLDLEFYITSPEIITKQKSNLDGTVKYLWRLNDNESVESVLMEYSHGRTVCISSQVGCKMGCLFCASSYGGFVRNLTTSEMLDQVLSSQTDGNTRVSSIVVMGMGEPLDNYDNLIRFIKLVMHPFGTNIGARHITVSTCGMIEYIDKLSEFDVQLTLAISLHAADDETRTYLIPSNRNVGVNNLVDAGNRFFAKTGRRVTYEYAMIDKINDTEDHADRLVKLLRNTKSHVNIITLSDIPNSLFKPSTSKAFKTFTNILSENNINYTVRRSLGKDIEAACGQLKNRTKQY